MKTITATQYNGKWTRLSFIEDDGKECGIHMTHEDLCTLKGVVDKHVFPCPVREVSTKRDTENIQMCLNELKFKIEKQKERIDNLTSYTNEKVYDLNDKVYTLECTINELRTKHNSLTEEMVRAKARMNAVEAIPEKDFRRDYCHDERLTLLETKADGLQKQINNTAKDLPRRVRAIVKESLKD